MAVVRPRRVMMQRVRQKPANMPPERGRSAQPELAACRGLSMIKETVGRPCGLRLRLDKAMEVFRRCVPKLRL